MDHCAVLTIRGGHSCFLRKGSEVTSNSLSFPGILDSLAENLSSSSALHYQNSSNHLLKNRLLAISQIKIITLEILHKDSSCVWPISISLEEFAVHIHSNDYKIYLSEWCQHQSVFPKHCGIQETTETSLRERILCQNFKYLLSCYLGTGDFRVGKLIQKIAQLFLLPPFYGVKVMQTALVPFLLLW